MVKKTVSIAVLYTLFAALSTVINISAQIVSIWAYKSSYSVEVSILIGTVAGLPLRYLLEKRYIFSFKSKNINHDGRLFMLYSFMGVVTTAIFWGVEYAFQLIFTTDTMRYFGGVIGLMIGFYFKYKLDKKYVFVNSDTKVVV
jgi:putative flippase GtrA